MSAEKNLQVVQQIYAAFGTGNVPAIMEHMADDGFIGFGVVSAAASDVPWHAQITKKADVPRFFEALGKNVVFTRFEPGSFAATADHVYCTVAWDGTLRKNGQQVNSEYSVHHFTFKNGRVIDWRGTEDTALVRDAWRV